MKPIYSLAFIALTIGAWQFLPSLEPLKIVLDNSPSAPQTDKSSPSSTPRDDKAFDVMPLWRQATQALNKETADWKLPEIELPAALIKELPGQIGAKTNPKVTSGAQLSRYEKILCDLANRERKAKGLKPLKISPALADVARAHSREMAQKGYFAHESPDPKRRTVMERYKLKFKEAPRLVAENIYKLEGPSFFKLSENDFRRAHTGWMKSPGHRANILRDSPAGGPTEIGVGIVVRNGSFWASQNFARP